MPEKAGKDEETGEAAEEGRSARKTGHAANAGIPVYLGVLLLVLGLVGGYALGIVLNAGEPCPKLTCPEPEKAVKIRLVYLSECGLCEVHNSIMDVFDAKGIGYEVEKIDAASPKGKLLVAEYGIIVAPTALVEKRYLDGYPEVRDAMERQFLTKNSNYIVPEANLNINKFYNRMYLSISRGSIDETCSTTENVAELLLFDDIYNPLSITQKPVFNSIVDALGSNIRFKYQFIQNDPLPADENTQNAISLTASYLMCAQQQGKYREMERAVLGIYCNQGGDEEELTEIELITCTMSRHMGIPLDGEELKRALGRTEIDKNVFDECLKGADDLKKKAVERARLYGTMRNIPSVVLACRYHVLLMNTEKAMCELNPGLEACKSVTVIHNEEPAQEEDVNA